MRVSRERLLQLITAMGREIQACTDDARRTDLQETWSWLVHRYTMAWGLPPELGEQLAALRGAVS